MAMNDQQIYNTDFPQFLTQLMKDRGLNLKKLSDVSGISIKHLEVLARGNFAALPSAPYFRGYLIKLGQLLDFDYEPWWTKLKEGGFVNDSGGHDRPPKNRFVKPSLTKIVLIAVLAALVVLYVGFQSTRIFGTPVITISYPEGNPALTTAQTITLAGTLKNGTNLYVNSELVSVAASGTWEKPILLSNSRTPIEIRATKFLGGETKIVLQIIYEPALTATSAIPSR